MAWSGPPSSLAWTIAGDSCSLPVLLTWIFLWTYRVILSQCKPCHMAFLPKLSNGFYLTSQRDMIRASLPVRTSGSLSFLLLTLFQNNCFVLGWVFFSFILVWFGLVLLLVLYNSIYSCHRCSQITNVLHLQFLWRELLMCSSSRLFLADNCLQKGPPHSPSSPSPSACCVFPYKMYHRLVIAASSR